MWRAVNRRGRSYGNGLRRIHWCNELAFRQDPYANEVIERAFTGKLKLVK